MKKNIFVFLILFFSLTLTWANQMVVVDVHRNIPLADDEPVFKDFLISFDESANLKKNLVVFVKRKINIKDSTAKSIGEVETTVGQLRIIHVDKKIAVAREYKLIPRDDEMALDQIGIMTGDSIDLAGSFTDSKPIVAKKKEREPSSSQAVVPLVNPPSSEGQKFRLNPSATPEI